MRFVEIRPDNNIPGGGLDGKSDEFVVGLYSNETGTARFQTMVWAWMLPIRFLTLLSGSGIIGNRRRRHR